MRVDPVATVTKFCVLIPLIALLPFSLPLILIAIIAYPYIIAKIYGLKVMPSMDRACFYGDDITNINFMS